MKTIILLILTSIFDLITTYIGISMGCIEINAISRILMDNNVFYLLRIILLLISVVGLSLAGKTNKYLRNTIYICTYLIIFVFTIAIINNLILILQRV